MERLFKVKGLVRSKITGFELEVEEAGLAPLTAIIGPNASGKTLFAKAVIKKLGATPLEPSFSILGPPFMLDDVDPLIELEKSESTSNYHCVIIPAERTVIRYLNVPMLTEYHRAPEYLIEARQPVENEYLKILDGIARVGENFSQLLRYLIWLWCFTDKWFDYKLFSKLVEETLAELRHRLCEQHEWCDIMSYLRPQTEPTLSSLQEYAAYIHEKPVRWRYAPLVPEGLHVIEVLRHLVALYCYLKHGELEESYGIVVLVEEPEIHGHPGLSFMLGATLSKLVDYAQRENLDGRLLILITTHSLEFLLGCLLTRSSTILYTTLRERGKWVLEEWERGRAIPGFTEIAFTLHELFERKFEEEL